MTKIMEIPKTKKCSCCREFKTLCFFGANKRMEDGLDVRCKPCISVAKRKHYSGNIEKYRIKNLRYREENKESLAISKKRWADSNKDRIKVSATKRHTEKYNTDPVYKFKFLIRNRIRNAIKRGYKTGSAIKDLGCSAEYAVEYIASKFTHGMSWDNHGEWHIDHIRPLTSFNLQDRADYLNAVHYTNLQPLWARDNLKKKAKYV